MLSTVIIICKIFAGSDFTNKAHNNFFFKAAPMAYGRKFPAARDWIWARAATVAMTDSLAHCSRHQTYTSAVTWDTAVGFLTPRVGGNSDQSLSDNIFRLDRVNSLNSTSSFQTLEYNSLLLLLHDALHYTKPSCSSRWLRVLEVLESLVLKW